MSDASSTNKQVMYMSFTPTSTGINPKKGKSGIDCANAVGSIGVWQKLCKDCVYDEFKS